MRRHAPSKEYDSCTVRVAHVNTSNKTSDDASRMVAVTPLLGATLQLFTHCRYTSIVFQWLLLRQQRQRKHVSWKPHNRVRQAADVGSVIDASNGSGGTISFIFKTLIAQISTNVMVKCGNKLLFVKKMAVTWNYCCGVIHYCAALYNYSHYKQHFHYC